MPNMAVRIAENTLEESEVVDLRDRQGRLYGKAFRRSGCVEIRKGNHVAMFDLTNIDGLSGEVLFCNSALVDRLEPIHESSTKIDRAEE